jgi:hypothetical protein
MNAAFSPCNTASAAKSTTVMLSIVHVRMNALTACRLVVIVSLFCFQDSFVQSTDMNTL